MSSEESDRLSSAPMLRRASKLCYALALCIAAIPITLLAASTQFIQYGATLLLPVVGLLLEIVMLLWFSLGFYLSKVGEELGVSQLRKGVLFAIPTIATFSAAFALFLVSSLYNAVDAVSGYILFLLFACLVLTLTTLLRAAYLSSKGMSEVTRRIQLGKVKLYQKAKMISRGFLWVFVFFNPFFLVVPQFWNDYSLVFGVVWAVPTFIIVTITLVMYGLAYGDPDVAALLPEPLPREDRGAFLERMAEMPKLMMEGFDEIEPDKTFETKRFKIMVKGETYILVPRFRQFVTSTPIFIRFFRKTTTPEKKLVVPYGWWMRRAHFWHRIADFPVTKVRGTFTMPVDVVRGSGAKPREIFAKGPGIAYIVKGYGGVRLNPFSSVTPPLLNRDVILEIIRELSGENAS